MSTADTITLLPIDDLHESPFNPRKIYDETSLFELAQDIGYHGRVLSPLLVRPRTNPLFKDDPNGAAGYEIVFGHRRFRAAQQAGLAELHCMVRSMSDDEARRAQISENLQRKDVHPIEEAEGFQALIDNDGETADRLAEQFGKSRSYVYGRLKLLEACPEIRKACLAGEIGSEVALLVARLRTPKLQEKALGYIRADWRADMKDGGQKSYRAIRDLLNEKFTLELKSAIFDIEDEMLVPLAGNCVRCTKRTGNAPEFEDVAEANTSASPMKLRADEDRWSHLTHRGADVCTDPDCFAAKKTAHLARMAELLKAEGKTVITGSAARSAVSAHGEVKGAYVALKDVQAELKKLPRKGLEGNANQPQVVLIQDPRTGKTHKAVKAAEVKAAGFKVKASGSSNSHQAAIARADEEREKRAAANAITRQVNAALLERTLQAMSGQARTTQELYWIANIVFDSIEWDVRKQVAARNGFEKPQELEKVLGQWDADRLAMFALECVLSASADIDEYRSYAPGEAHKQLLLSAKHYGVDVDQVRAELAPPTTAAQAQGKGAGKTATKSAPAAKKAKGTKKQKDDVLGEEAAAGA